MTNEDYCGKWNCLWKTNYTVKRFQTECCYSMYLNTQQRTGSHISVLFARPIYILSLLTQEKEPIRPFDGNLHSEWPSIKNWSYIKSSRNRAQSLYYCLWKCLSFPLFEQWYQSIIQTNFKSILYADISLYILANICVHSFIYIFICIL